MIREEQMKLFLDEIQQKQLNDYIKDEEDYSKYEEEMMKIYNNDQENDEIREESSYEYSDESSEEDEEECKQKLKRKRKTKLKRLLDNKFVLFLGVYLIYEIIYGTE